MRVGIRDSGFGIRKGSIANPLLARRIKAFRANKRALWSLRVFLLLFTLTLFAELIANDKPLLMAYRGELYAPIFHTYSEQEFGGDFETEAVYRDPDFITRISADGWMFWPPLRYGYSTINYDLGRSAPTAPDANNWLGTDDQGRDVLARVMYGFRVSIIFSLILTGISAVVGIAAGAVQGYFGGWVDLLFQRFIEIWSGLPVLFMLIILSSFVEPSLGWLLLILLLFSWMNLTGVVRAEFLRARNFDYVKAARVLGVSEFRIMVRHVLPNALTAAMTMLPFMLSAGVTALTTLDFLGFGLPAGSPSLGELLLQGKNNPQAPWLGITGFIIISLQLTLIIFISEGVRDAFDDRKGMRK